jgi:hypothetical protein
MGAFTVIFFSDGPRYIKELVLIRLIQLGV